MRLTLLASAWLVACGGSAGPVGPLRLETAAAGGATRITLIAAPGYKISARLKPALELSGGQVIRLDSPHLTPDSAYFTQPPSAVIPQPDRMAGGRLRASICDPGATVCRSVVIKL